MKTIGKVKKINVVTLGCSKNLVDSETLMQQLVANGIEVTHDSSEPNADVVIINTCGFIKDAKQESIDTILQYVAAKERGDIGQLIVMGCLSERYKELLAKELPEVDLFFGVSGLQALVESLQLDYRTSLYGEKQLSTPGHYAYLKISEGCNRACSFCAIPIIRGKYSSKSIENVLSEAVNLVENGAKELILIAQDISYYGIDRHKKQELTILLRELEKIEQLRWIRLQYAYPANFPMEILPLMANSKKICSYLDLPLQHINDNMLTIMKRGHTRTEAEHLIERIRDEVPGVALRTTMLVGHPGETKRKFTELLRFVEKTRFDRLGVFTYSHEEDTWSWKTYKDRIPEKEKHKCSSQIMEVQQTISAELNRMHIGKILDVLIDRQEGDFFVGRTEFDSPEVDNEVLINRSSGKLNVGEIYKIKITESDDFDLYGTNETLG